MKPDIFRALIYSELWHILNPCYIQNPVKYIRWSILFRTLKYSIFKLLIHSKTLHIQNSRHSKYWESLKYILHRTMCNPDIFKTWQIESPRNTQKPVKHVWLAVFYKTLCNTGIFRTRGIFRTMSNIYDGKFYWQTCVTPAYLEPWHIQDPRHIQNTAKDLSRNIPFKTLCNPDIFKNLVYSELWYILKSKHIQNPAGYLRRSILLRTLCNNSRFRGPIYSKRSHIQK